MKAKYIKPTSITVDLYSEDLMIITTSNPTIDKNDGGNTGGSEALSGQGGWSSDNWTNNEE